LTQPNELRITVPNRPPDMHFPPPYRQGAHTVVDPWAWAKGRRDLGQTATYVAIWHPTPTEPGCLIAQHHNPTGKKIRPTTAYCYDAVRAHELGGQGLRGVLEMAGIFTSWYPSARDPGVENIEMTIPSAPNFCKSVDQAFKKGLAHVRFATTHARGTFGSPALTKSLALRRRMLLPDAQIENATYPLEDWQLAEFDLAWHDMFTHGIAYLGLGKRVAGRLFGRARLAYACLLLGRNRLSKWLTNRTENEITAGDLQKGLSDPEGNALAYFKPLLSRKPAAYHLRKQARRMKKREERGLRHQAA